MRVAIVTENFLPKLDGVTRTLAMLLEHLQRRGHQALVLGPEGSPRRYAGARVFGARGVPLPIYPELRLLLPEPELERRLALFRPDVIHVVDPMLLGAAGILWAQRLVVPVVSSYHTNLAAYCTYFRLAPLVNPMWHYRRFVHNACAATLCPSPSTAWELRRRGFHRVGLWQRGVDANLFHPRRRSDAWRRNITGPIDRPIVLYAGRLSYEKNLGALVSAFQMAQQADAHLVFVGDGPARSDLEQSLTGQSVTFTGYLSGEALAEAYASADIFAFPSLTETFGQVVQEAMASGLPIVAFDGEGVRDVVRHGETGLLAQGSDVAAFGTALGQLVRNAQQRTRLGMRGREIAAQRTWESVMDSLLDVYHDAVVRRAFDFAA
jgi:glycosyltransferase involved in cell wall biosynthesis